MAVHGSDDKTWTGIGKAQCHFDNADDLLFYIRIAALHLVSRSGPLVLPTKTWAVHDPNSW